MVVSIKLEAPPGTSLRSLVKGFVPVAEVFLISFYGWGTVHDQFKQFSSRVEHNLKVTPSLLISRFEKYSKCPSLVT